MEIYLKQKFLKKEAHLYRIAHLRKFNFKNHIEM